ncbi:MAG: restriction endonuclease subunit S [Deltaproteobacteria bacterium]|nr:restriction endonuclease subunit S [Deltaproteobacteria bacterium]
MTGRTEEDNYKETELGLLPEDWDIVMLGDIAKISSGGSAPQGKHYFNGNYPFIRVRHIDNEGFEIRKFDLITNKAVKDYKLKLYTKGTIVFPKSGASVYLEKRAVLPVDAYIVSHLCAVISNSSDVLQKFLFYMLRNIKLAKEKADGYPTLNLSEIKRTPIVLPALPEQKKIAYVLSTIQQAKEKTENAIASLRELKKSLMKHLFRYGPVSVKDAEKVKLKETEIGEIPEGWEVVELGKVATLQRGKDLPRQQWLEGNIPIVGSGGIMGFHNVAVCKGPGVVTGRSGSIGKVTYIKENYWPHNTGLYVKNFHGNKPKFVYYLFHTLNFKKYATGVSVPTLNRNFIHAEKVQVPPLHIQEEISLILSTIDKKIETLENRKKALEELFRSMLENLMTAKIRVNHLEIGDG